MNETKLKLLRNVKSTSGELEFPRIKPSGIIPLNLIGFNELLTANPELLKISHIHFFLDDYQFERFWNSPTKYLDKLKKARGVIGADYSCYVDAPNAFNMWNVFRNRLLDMFLQMHGVEVIPTAVWGGEKTFKWCFDGLPLNSIIAVNTFGSLKRSKQYFLKGFRKMMKVLKPHTVIVYGEVPEELQKEYSEQICNYASYCKTKWHKNRVRRSETE